MLHAPPLLNVIRAPEDEHAPAVELASTTKVTGDESAVGGRRRCGRGEQYADRDGEVVGTTVRVGSADHTDTGRREGDGHICLCGGTDGASDGARSECVRHAVTGVP